MRHEYLGSALLSEGPLVRRPISQKALYSYNRYTRVCQSVLLKWSHKMDVKPVAEWIGFWYEKVWGLIPIASYV